MGSLTTRKWYGNVTTKGYGNDNGTVYRVPFTIPHDLTIASAAESILVAAKGMFDMGDYRSVDCVVITHFATTKGRMVELPHNIIVYRDGTTYGI